MSAVNHEIQGKGRVRTQRAEAVGTEWRRVAIYLLLAVGFFLLGAAPMWLKANDAARQRDAAQRELRSTQLQNTLSSAVIDARLGEYETARQTTSDFFTGLRHQLEVTGEEQLFTAPQSEKMGPILAQRDDIITLLARSDPAAADRLTQLYVSYRQAVSGAQPADQK